MAQDYRRAVEDLGRVLVESEVPEAREDAIPRIRALIDSITVSPAAVGLASLQS